MNPHGNVESVPHSQSQKGSSWTVVLRGPQNTDVVHSMIEVGWPVALLPFSRKIARRCRESALSTQGPWASRTDPAGLFAVRTRRQPMLSDDLPCVVSNVQLA